MNQDPKFLKISPKGLVPAIVTKGKPIPESLVIMEYLEDGAYLLN
jgi:glutathione S-transferase